jgi:DNA-binding SARP family transcriptional activator
MITDHDDLPVRDQGHPDATVVHLFAGPYVTVGAERHEVPEGSKQLLAFVALRRRRVERRQAAGALWPSGNEERAAGNLRSALWRLRRAGINVLTADKRSLVLYAHVTVDVHVIDQWATRLIQGIPSGHDLVVSPSIPEALDLLPGWYDDWALLEHERIRQRVLHALEALSARLASLGRFGEAVDAALLAVSAEPLRESAQRALIEAHVAEGNLAEAHRSFMFYRGLVRRELGVEPSSDLSVLLRVHRDRPADSTSRTATGRQPGRMRPLTRAAASRHAGIVNLNHV